MLDMTEVLAAGARLRKIESYYFTGVHPKQDAYEQYNHIDGFDVEEDRMLLSRAFIHYFDTTPLTVERLAEAGFRAQYPHGPYILDSLGIVVDTWHDPWLWRVGDVKLTFPPCTVGDLRRLLYQLQRGEGK